MSKIKISEEGYNEIREIVNSCNFDNINIRIGYPRNKNSRPVLYIGEVKDTDIVEKVGDFNFIMTLDLLNEYGGFITL
jgi:hypothetical protein